MPDLIELLTYYVIVLLLFVAGCAQPALANDEKQAASAGKSSYLKSIKPLLRDKCFACHSARKQEGGLRLDAASLIRKGGDSGPAHRRRRLLRRGR